MHVLRLEWIFNLEICYPLNHAFLTHAHSFESRSWQNVLPEVCIEFEKRFNERIGQKVYFQTLLLMLNAGVICSKYT